MGKNVDFINVFIDKLNADAAPNVLSGVLQITLLSMANAADNWEKALELANVSAENAAAYLRGDNNGS